MAIQLGLAQQIAQTRRLPPEKHPRGFYELTLEWLNDPQDDVRREALLYLARHLRQRADAQAMLDMVVGDWNADVRRIAAECLGGVFRNSRNTAVAEVLARVSRNANEDRAVRAAANAAIKRINSR
jgi:HEAT repeat protein